MGRKARQSQERYGICEMGGTRLARQSADQRRKLARTIRAGLPCPFRPGRACSKDCGVCTMVLYEVPSERVGQASPKGPLVTMCPNRLCEGGLIFKWIGKEILGSPDPIVVGEVPFLERSDGKRAVGKIDHILVHPDTAAGLQWCALETQAVYFSGDNMDVDLDQLRTWAGDGMPLPKGRRRPDFRSSGPKRLMPQLEIKVPTLRRWGRKMCVAVDESFFHALGEMNEVEDPSNADIAWFVVTYREDGDRYRIAPSSCHFTTLEEAVTGLTAGSPSTLSAFEKRIRAKIDLPPKP